MKNGKVVLGLLMAALGGLMNPAIQAATQTVVVGTYSFTPALVSIFPGDTIIWTNRALIAHDSTQGSATTPDSQRLWKSPNLVQLTGNFRFTFATPGVYPYVCLQHISLHPEQTGTVTVVGGNIPPTVAMTAPGQSSGHPAPPNFITSASASDQDGVVTNVLFTAFNSTVGTVNLGSVTTAPYSLRVTNLQPANYQFRAIAMDNGGASSTSAVLNVRIAVPATLQLTAPAVNAGQFEFEIPTTLALSYVIEESRGFDGTWVGVSTLTGSGNTMKISRPFDTSSQTQRFYRVFIQP